MSDRQNDRPEEGGLFSEDYETPKRENPYLKKNRVKAREDRPAADKPAASKSSSYRLSPLAAR